MQVLPIQAIAKQAFSVVLDGVLYDIAILETNNCMSLNVTRAGVDIADGRRAVAGQLILARNEEGGLGNFFFLTQNGEIPYYTSFNVSQSFLYASVAELDAVRDGGGREFVAYPFVTVKGAGTAVGAASAQGVGHHV